MGILKPLLSMVLLATPLVAQNAPIPQDLPLPLRQTGEAIRRKVEQPSPQARPLQRPRKWLETPSLVNRINATNRQTPAAERSVNPGSVEDRIAALESKIEALQIELEAQKTLIQQLQELLNRQQQKN